jgi:hypothetical protein
VNFEIFKQVTLSTKPKTKINTKNTKPDNFQEVVVFSKLSLLLNEKTTYPKDWSWGWELNPYRAALQATA